VKKHYLFMAALAAFALSVGPAKAEWPNDKPIKMVVPFSPGGGMDTYVRSLAKALGKELGVNVVPENIPGAGGKKGTTVIYKADPDGYTFGILNVPGVTVAKIRGDKLAFDPEKFTWLINVADSPYAVVASGKSKVNSMKDLCNLGRPAKFAQTGPAATAYVTAKIVMETLGCDYKMITGYKGTSEAITAMLRGEVDASVRPLGSTAKYVKSGDLKVIMKLNKEDAAAVGKPELGKLGLYRMFAGPPGMSADLTKKVSDALVRAANSPEMKEFVKKKRDSFQGMGAAEADKLNRDLLAYYGRYKSMLKK